MEGNLLGIIDVEKRRLNIYEICAMAAYFSLAVVSAYPAFLTFDVPFPAVILFAVLLFAPIFVGLYFGQVFKLHVVGALLLLRLLLFTINSSVITVDTETLLEQFFTTFCSILILTVCFNRQISVKKVLLPFILLTDLQVVYSVVFNGFSFDKALVVAGIGGSNYIATFLLAYITYLLFTKRDLFYNIVLFITIPAFLLTQSFAAYIGLFVVFVVWAVNKINWKSAYSIGNACAIGMIMLCAVVFFLHTKFGAPVYNLVKSKLSYLFSGNFKDFSSSRTELYSFSFENIKRHILFGSINNVNDAYGADYRFQNFRTHNFLLESLLLYGIVGTIINAMIAGIFFKECGCKAKFPYLMVFIAVLVHGLFEPNFFTMHFEIVIWLFIGCGLKKERGASFIRY